ETTTKVEAKEAAGGISILADKNLDPKLRETLEKYNDDKSFQDLMERKIKETKDEKERERYEEELRTYRKLSDVQRAQAREAAMREAVDAYRPGETGRISAGKVLAIGGTIIAIGMLADMLLSETKSSGQPTGPAVKPTVK